MVSEKRALREKKEPHIQKILIPFIFRIVSRARFWSDARAKCAFFCMQTARIVKKKTFFLKKSEKIVKKRSFSAKFCIFLSF